VKAGLFLNRRKDPGADGGRTGQLVFRDGERGSLGSWIVVRVWSKTERRPRTNPEASIQWRREIQGTSISTWTSLSAVIKSYSASGTWVQALLQTAFW